MRTLLQHSPTRLPWICLLIYWRVRGRISRRSSLHAVFAKEELQARQAIKHLRSHQTSIPDATSTSSWLVRHHKWITQPTTKTNTKNMTNNSQLLIQIVLTALFIIIVVSAQDEDINSLFCQLNDYAKERVNNQLNVFPCKQQWISRSTLDNNQTRNHSWVTRKRRITTEQSTPNQTRKRCAQIVKDIKNMQVSNKQKSIKIK